MGGTTTHARPKKKGESVTSDQVTSNQIKTISNPGYKKLLAWERADELAEYVYTLTYKFPKEELFGLTSQLRRAVLSIPLNIVEGHARFSKKEFARFLLISLGSLAETEYLLEFCYRRKLITELEYTKAARLRQDAGNIIWKLYKSIK